MVNTESLNLKRLLMQQLRSFEASGLSSLPAGTGEVQFNLPIDADAEGTASDQSAEQVQSGQHSHGQAERPTEGSSAAKPQSPNVAMPKAPAMSGCISATPAAQIDGTTLPGSELALPYPQSLPLAQRQQQLTVLQDLVAGCTRCAELASSRTQTVFGVGAPAARLVFVGEAPGADEDRQGEPFVGAAGQLLSKILDACQLSREQVYILNVVKCRPPGNRNPSDEERSCCWGYAREQLEILQPEFICCLGSVAAKSLLNTKQPLGRMRQQFHAYRGSRVIVTYHPAYLLRTPSAKRHVWDDMKLLMKAMGVDL